MSNREVMSQSVGKIKSGFINIYFVSARGIRKKNKKGSSPTVGLEPTTIRLKA